MSLLRRMTSLARHQSILRGIGKQALGIPVRSENVEILDTPSRFYEALQQGVKDSSHRISMASLYFGLGTLEHDLLDLIADNVIAKPALRATFLFDAMRSTRPSSPTETGFSKSSEMLSKLLVSKCKRSSAEERLQVSLYQTPDLSKVLKLVLPSRINEVVGVCHLKAYIFDDDVLISGANLSATYFTNRQDRYIWFRKSKRLANHFADLIDVVSTFSYKLDENGQVVPNSSLVDPLQDPLTFKMEMGERVKKLVSPTADFGSSSEDCLSLDGSGSDTWVFPTVQMGPLGVAQDELCTQWLLRNLATDSRIHLASAYFNLTPELENVVLDASRSKIVSILTASPEANGFYGASGVSGFIPHAYSLLEKSLYETGQRIQRKNENAGLRIHEYLRKGWTFHAKGLWCSLPEEPTTSITLIGSSNFGYRSRHRDLEAQLFLLTLNPQLRSLLEHEKSLLYSFATPVVNSHSFEHGRLNNIAASMAARAIRSWL